ncbi:MAG: glycosyltransferase [Lacipirellulaceae bacterium]
MPVLHVISQLDRYGGSYLLRAVARQNPAQHKIIAFEADSQVVEELNKSGVEVRVIIIRGGWDFLALGRLAKHIRGQRPSAVHVWDVTALMKAKLTTRRATQLIYSIQATDLEQPWAAKLIHALRNKLAAVVVPDEPHQTWCEEQDIAREKIHEVTPAVAIPHELDSQSARQDLLKELQLPEETELIVAAGPLLRDKKLDEAIWCYELVRVLHPKARLVIVGDGSDRARLERHARLVSDASSIYFLGERENATKLIAAADVFWQPSLSRTTPIALLEAMAAGRAIVANEIPAHQAVIREGETGRLAPIIDRAKFTKATNEFLEDADLRQKLAEAAAKNVAEHHSLQATIASLLQLYK